MGSSPGNDERSPQVLQSFANECAAVVIWAYDQVRSLDADEEAALNTIAREAMLLGLYMARLRPELVEHIRRQDLPLTEQRSNDTTMFAAIARRAIEMQPFLAEQMSEADWEPLEEPHEIHEPEDRREQFGSLPEDVPQEGEDCPEPPLDYVCRTWVGFQIAELLEQDLFDPAQWRQYEVDARKASMYSLVVSQISRSALNLGLDLASVEPSFAATLWESRPAWIGTGEETLASYLHAAINAYTALGGMLPLAER